MQEADATGAITRWGVRAVLAEACPRLEEASAAANAELNVGEDRLTYHEVSEVVRLMGAWQRSVRTACFPPLFAAFERCLLERSDEAVELILVGVFEDSQNGNITEIDDFSVWQAYLHPVGTRGWKAVVDFCGGGVAADPVGYLEIGPAGATFKPISAARLSPAFLLAAGVTAAIVIRALARLLGR